MDTNTFIPSSTRPSNGIAMCQWINHCLGEHLRGRPTAWTLQASHRLFDLWLEQRALEGFNSLPLPLLHQIELRFARLQARIEARILNGNL
jgi:hypothetical protein